VSERHSEAVICQECDVNIAYDLSEFPVCRACEHLEPICSECWPGSCVPCRLEAEQEMYRSGDYDPAKDPMFDHTAPTPVDHIAERGGYSWDGSWVDVPRKERP